MPDTSLERLFAIPNGGPVKLVKGKNKGSNTITLERDVAAGAPPLQDIVAKSQTGKPLMTSSVSVAKLPSGDIQYDEDLKWVGPAQKFDQMSDVNRLRVEIKSALPERFRTSTPVIDRAVQAAVSSGVHAVMGPPYPILFDLMGNPDAAMFRIRSAISATLGSELARALPELTQAELDATQKTIAAKMDFSKMSDSGQPSGMAEKMGAGAAGDSDVNELSAMFFEVSFPGRVVETNGLFDPVTGHVYWSLYPLSTAFGNVDLKVTVRP
jgi:hypothetical protein